MVVVKKLPPGNLNEMTLRCFSWAYRGRSRTIRVGFAKVFFLPANDFESYPHVVEFSVARVPAKDRESFSWALRKRHYVFPCEEWLLGDERVFDNTQV